MENLKTESPWGPIRNLLAVLFAGVLAAGLFALFMLYNYGPTGHYVVNNVLLSPETLTNIAFVDPERPGAKSPRYHYDRIEYSNWDAGKKQWNRMAVSQENYRQFYQNVASEKSILDVSHEVVNQFYSVPPSKLTIYVRTQGENRASDPSGKAMQVVEFSNDGNYFRIELHGQEGSDRWAYFSHPLILSEVTELFANPQVSK